MVTPTDTYQLIHALTDEFVRCGMQDACTSPGSRNTPIVLTLAREHRLRTSSHIDERSAGFFALGAAKASGRPVAVTCTSGTAAANLVPAVIEAHEARVPLIVLTADRPPELREIGAGQTIDQLKLYGGAVRWFFELGVQEATPERLRWIRTLACRAYWTALGVGGVPGPVHLNLPLREPLILDQPLPEDDSGRADGAPYTRAGSGSSPRSGAGPSTSGAGGEESYGARPIIVAGRDERTALTAKLPNWAEWRSVPLLADPMSRARSGRGAIAHYDLLLRSAPFTAAHRPTAVVRVGELPVSKPLRAWLAELDVPQIAVDPEFTWHDPGSRVGERVATLHGVARADPEWLHRWQQANTAAARAIDAALGEELSEPLIARRLGETLPTEATLFCAASMPIRDIEEFWPARPAPPAVLSNRGANGIDGTVSSAYGAASVATGPVVLLIGDVALLHDIGGLMNAARLGTPLTIVLLNNDGGGIFHFLAVAGEGDTFTEHVATPHGRDFAHAAALYGAAHEPVATLEAFDAALVRSLGRPGTTIIEVRTDRVENRTLHAEVADAALAALAG